MLNISFDLSTLEDREKEALAGLLLNTMMRPVSLDKEPKPKQVTELPDDDLPSDESELESPVSAEEAFNNSGPQLVKDTPATGNTDKTGLPWDERIHASTKALTAEGVWRKKRGVDETLVAQVEGELKNLMSLPVPEPSPISQSEKLPEPPATTAATLPEPPATTGPVVTTDDPKKVFVDFVNRASAAMQTNKLTNAELVKACNDFGIPTFPMLGTRLDLVPAVAAEVDKIIASRG